MKNLTTEEMASLLAPLPTLKEQNPYYDRVARWGATNSPLNNALANPLFLKRRAAPITAAVTRQNDLGGGHHGTR